MPYPLCAQGWVLRRLIADPDPRFRPDAIEAFNPTTLGRPWHGRVVRFAAEHGPADGRQQRRPRRRRRSARAGRRSRAATADDLRQAIVEGRTHHHGSFHGTAAQLGTFGQQLRKYGRDARDTALGKIRRDGTARDLGYPGGRHRPPRLEEALAAERAGGAPEPRITGGRA